MVYKVVSTKLTEEQHTALLEECNRLGYTPSAFVRNVIIEKVKIPDDNNIALGSDSQMEEAPRRSALMQRLAESGRRRAIDEQAQQSKSGPLVQERRLSHLDKITASYSCTEKEQRGNGHVQ